MDDPRTLKFLVFVIIGVSSLMGGYFARKKNLVSEEVSRKIHYHTVLWVWTTGGVLSIWLMKPALQQLWMFLVIPAGMGASIAAGVWAGRKWALGRSQIGALAVGAGISNTGGTMTAYLAYLFIKPADQALAYANAACYLMLFMSVAMVYPVAQKYAGPEAQQQESAIKQVIKSYLDVRSIGLWSCIVGLILTLSGVPFPRVFVDFQVLHYNAMDVLALAAAVGGYYGIGLKLRFGEWRAYMREHVVMGVVKFVVCPAVTMGAILLIGAFFTPLPKMEVMVLMLASSAPAGISMVIVSNLFQLDSRMASIVWLLNTGVFLVLVLPIAWGLIQWFS